MSASPVEPRLASSPDASLSGDGDHLSSKHTWLDGFRRITTAGTYIPEIDGLRFVAISVVILHHLSLFVSTVQDHPQGMMALGQKGVEMFFVISGLVLGIPFAMQGVRKQRRVSLTKYFIRRLTRLEPPYLLSLFILFPIKVILRNQAINVYGWNLLLSVFYIHGFAMGVESQTNGVAWSLEVEIQFYLLMPLLGCIYFIPNRWIRRGLLVALAGGCMAIQPVPIRGYLSGLVFYRTLINFIQYFLAGLLLADIFATEWAGVPPAAWHRHMRWPIGWGDVAWLLGLPLTVYLLTLGEGVTRLILPISCFVLYLGVFYSRFVRSLLRVELLTVLGGMCYSIYLFHNSVIEIAGHGVKRFLPGNFHAAVGVSALIMIPLILIFCGTVYRLVEKPCMRPDWPARLWRWFGSILFVDVAAVEGQGDQSIHDND